MLGRKFYECGRRPHAGHLLDKIEGGIGVLVSEFEELIVVVLHTLNRSQITVLDEVGRFSRGDTHFLVRFFGLGGSLFSHFSECLRSACLCTGGLCVHIHVPVVFVFISMRQFFLVSLGSFPLWIRDALSADSTTLN